MQTPDAADSAKTQKPNWVKTERSTSDHITQIFGLSIAAVFVAMLILNAIFL
jgi:hypothetical protein